MPADPTFCAGCAARGRTCCQSTQVFLTRGDLDRIGGFAGDEPFFEFLPVAGDDCSPDPLQDHAWCRTFGPDGKRRVLAHRPGGDCNFLIPAGCRLPEEARPLVCRLYPFEYNDAAVKGVHGHLCPHPEAANAPLLLALLGMDRNRAESWRVELYREILEEFPD